MKYYSDSIHREIYEGTSTENKPVANSMQVGSLYREYDTGKEYYYTGIAPDYWIDNPFPIGGGNSGGSTTSGTGTLGACQW